MLVKMWNKGNTHPLPVRVQTCVDIMEISLAILQENGNPSTLSSSYTTLGHITKSCPTAETLAQPSSLLLYS